jgi:hypothetical protein
MSGPTVLMSGSLKNTQPFKFCSKCEKPCEPAGGIQMSPTKWRCALCWRGFNAQRK